MRGIMGRVWLVILVFGLITFVGGIVLTVAGAIMPRTIVNGIKDINLPTISYNSTSPQTLYLAMDLSNPMDTPAEIRSSTDAVKSAMDMLHPSTQMLQVATRTLIVPDVNPTTGVVTYIQIQAPAPGIQAAMADQNWVNLLTFFALLNSAKGGIAAATLYLLTGIGLILAGIALMLGAFVVHRTGVVT